MKIYNIQQGTQEWFDIRKLKMTGSKAQAIGNNSKGLETYIYELVADYYSSQEKEQYTNEDLERGNELEEQARGVYELETGNKTEQVGFIELDEFTGVSPDGLVGKDGGLEIKCLNDKRYFKELMSDKRTTDYDWQIQMCLYVTGRKWWDLVIYNPNFKQNIIIYRIESDEEKQEQLKVGLETGKQIIKDLINKYNKKIYE
jgi:putative phage-type endonuclease